MNAIERASESRRALSKRLGILEKRVALLNAAIETHEGGGQFGDEEQPN